jgi:hypothetical protein
MSTASASREVKFFRKSCTYTTILMSTGGDLWQEYTQEGTSIRVSPDWEVEANQPTLEFVCTSSRTATGEVVIAAGAIDWYINGTKIVFGSNGISTGTFAGLFKKVTTDNKRQGLKIVNNIAAAMGYASCVVKCVVTVQDGSITDELTSSYTIPIQESSGNSFKVTIAANDSYNFVLGENNNSVGLKAMVYYNGGSYEGTPTYQWYENTGKADWTLLSGKTSQTLTVYKNESDGSPYVDTYKEFMVKVYSADGAEIGQDVQGVMDVTDPYAVVANPSPSDETITEGSGGTVSYYPQVVKRKTGAAISNQPTFNFYARGADGVVVSSKTNVTVSTGKTGFSVSEDDCINAGGDLSVVMVSNDF